tara:strand:- start:646 stop:1524 length:879 start_codon:yes stop_codon:yes gene_type:complete
MKQINSAMFLLIILITSCLSKNEKNAQLNTSEYHIELSNIEEFEIDEQLVTIGSIKSYYFEKESPRILINNLPARKFTVKIDGIEMYPNQKNGTYVYKPKGLLGRRLNSIQIFDSIGNEVLKHTVKYHIGRIKPFLESEHGIFLFEGVSTKVEISNIAMACPYVVLSSNHAKITANADGTYDILPNYGTDTVEVFLETNHEIFEQQFYVLPPPPPKFYFYDSDDLRCVQLIPSGMFTEIEYKIVKIYAVELYSNSQLTFENTNCIRKEKNIKIQKFIYTIGNFTPTHTVWLE